MSTCWHPHDLLYPCESHYSLEVGGVDLLEPPTRNLVCVPIARAFHWYTFTGTLSHVISAQLKPLCTCNHSQVIPLLIHSSVTYSIYLRRG